MKTSSKFPDLLAAVAAAHLRVLGHADVRDHAQARVMAALLRVYGDSAEGFIYAEPVIPQSDVSPDVVLALPDVGVLVVEVKAYEIDYIQGVEAGNLKIRRNGGVQQVNPLRQAQRGMYALKTAYEQVAPSDVTPLYNALVAFPNMTEAAWNGAGYEDIIPRRAILFAEDFSDTERLKARLAKHIQQTLALSGLPQPLPPHAQAFLDQIFGQSATLKTRQVRQLAFKNMGAEIDRLESEHKQLSPEQLELIHADNWGHPYLLRGVAGSGKSIVLAYQAAQVIIRHERRLLQLPLFDEDRQIMPEIVVITLQRTLVPLLRGYIEAAYHKLTGQALPAGRVSVHHLNGFIYDLADRHPHFHYIPLTKTANTGERSREYLAQLDQMKPADLDKLRVDAIFLDEGQDLHPDTLALLHTLIRPHPQTAERSFSIYYDDAQNIYGHQRPTWRTFGVNVEGGRAAFMKKAYRNSREIIELGLNVLLGAAADDKTRVQTRRFADIYTLQEKGLAEESPQGWRVHFAEACGEIPQVEVFPTRSTQIEWVAELAISLIQVQQVRPEDLLILSNTAASMSQLEGRIRTLSGNSLPTRLVGGKNRHTLDEALLIPQVLTISQISHSKGYDAPMVILMDVDQLARSVTGRAIFYVGVTRAKRYLILTGVKAPDTLLTEAYQVHSNLFASRHDAAEN